MKTLREAYESVGLCPEMGDIIGVHKIEDMFVTGEGSDFISFYKEEQDAREWYCTSDNWADQKVPIIRRRGKQIYPKVEKALALPAYYKEGNALIKFYAERLNVDIIAAQELTNLLFDYVCVIIEYKESK